MVCYRRMNVFVPLRARGRGPDVKLFPILRNKFVLCFVLSDEDAFPENCIDLEGRMIMKHRRALKLTLLALLLMTATLLSGCVVKPDDIAANGQQSGSNIFPEYNPATPVPSLPTAASTTNNPFAGTTGGMISLPTSMSGTVNPWVITTIGPLSTISRATAPSVTAPAHSATPAATTQGSLKLGSKGESVKQVQRKLKDLGFYTGHVDGDFGEGTEKAVKAFQKQYGLTVDGKVGSNTMAKLSSARATAKPAATATPRPTATPSYSANTYLRYGDSGAKVKQMQERLIKLGYLSGKADGDFGSATEAAVIAFQKRHCPYSDGIAGPDTLKALYSSSAKPTSSSAGVSGVTLEKGSKGDAVRTLQSRLKKLGYYTGTVDGDFGDGTVAAVKAFQRANGLTADGRAGTSTLNKLYSSSAKSAAAAATTRPVPTRRPTVTPYRTPTPLPPNTYIRVTPNPSGDYVNLTLRPGYYGTPVERMQNALRQQGYYTGNVDGKYGDGTKQAVEAFQRTHGLAIDGVAGPATLRVLYEGSYPIGS